MAKQLLIKPDKCIACRTCELVCSFSHFDEFNPRLSAVNVVNYYEDFISVPVMCLQCDEACCEKVCPVGALSRDEDGVIAKDSDKCIVCKMCVSACPLGNMSYSPLKQQVIKCDNCDGDPMCAKFCKGNAIEAVEPEEVLDRKKTVADDLKDTYREGA